jgi:hypothetical protein
MLAVVGVGSGVVGVEVAAWVGIAAWVEVATWVGAVAGDAAVAGASQAARRTSRKSTPQVLASWERTFTFIKTSTYKKFYTLRTGKREAFLIKVECKSEIEMPSPTSTLKVAYSSSLNLKLPFWRPEKIKIGYNFSCGETSRRSERNYCDIREKEKKKEVEPFFIIVGILLVNRTSSTQHSPLTWSHL